MLIYSTWLHGVTADWLIWERFYHKKKIFLSHRPSTINEANVRRYQEMKNPLTKKSTCGCVAAAGGPRASIPAGRGCGRRRRGWRVRLRRCSGAAGSTKTTAGCAASRPSTCASAARIPPEPSPAAALRPMDIDSSFSIEFKEICRVFYVCQILCVLSNILLDLVFRKFTDMFSICKS